VLRNWSIVRTGTTAAQKSLFFNLRRLRARIAASSQNENLTEAGRAAISEELGVKEQDVRDMEQRLAAGDQSLNAPIGEEGEDQWQDLLSDERSDPEDVVIGLRDSETRSAWLARALEELTPREQTIIERRRLTDDGATLEQLGTELGVSKERVRQLESRALGKLRKSLMKHVDRPADLFGESG